MDENRRQSGEGILPSLVAFLSCMAAMIVSVAVASWIQEDGGRIHVTNVHYQNFNGIPVRAKLLRPRDATSRNPMPGIVHIHGYQNNRETGDAYSIELARRGFVVLSIDAIGRGNSGMPNDPTSPDFDKSYGGRSSLEYTRSLPFVDPERVGLAGHSLGAEMVYEIALKDGRVNAIVISGFAYTTAASESMPRNMLMIIGKWDEFRKRMTGTKDILREWMTTPQTARTIPVVNPQFGVTYGSFAEGTARRVYVPSTIHFLESHHRGSIAELVTWMKQALHPPETLWIDPSAQTWHLKEWATLLAMIACFASLLPLGNMLMRIRPFTLLRGTPQGAYSCSAKSYILFAGVNGVIMWLYLPLIFILFGVHVYLVRIDRVFPMMMTNGVIWWFFSTNVIGFFVFRYWLRRRAAGCASGNRNVKFTYEERPWSGIAISGTILLGITLFGFAYLCEHLLETLFIVDFRFIFPFASDLTPTRALIGLVYLPFILVGFMLFGRFLHGPLRVSPGKSVIGTFVKGSLANMFAVILPVVLFLLLQYLPLFTTGFIPFVGPGGMFVTFVLGLFHIIGVLMIVIPISTWFYETTGRIHLGAFLNSLIVTWMFASSQVVAPIPV